MINDDQKLALVQNSNESFDKMINISREGLLKFGKISIPYLMRKLKCSESIAFCIMNELEQDF